MIQITGLRPRQGTTLEQGDLEDYSIFDKYKVTAPSIQDLFENIEDYLKELPEKEHWNLFFTVASCGARKREFESQSVIAFDIDGIDNTKHESYIEIFCKTMGVRREETGIVASGNGLHFYIGLQVPIVDKKFFTQNRHHYKALLDILSKSILDSGLALGKVDPSIFDARRILRLPRTINKKVGRADTVCTMLQPKILPVAFDITKASGVPSLKTDEALPKDFMRKYPKTDNDAILKGCDFIKWAREKPAEVSEPQWYAALSITARMEHGAQLSHDMSKGHPTYSWERTEAKIEHAIQASPPRKCSSINQVWGHCRGCPNFEKVESPIMLRSPDKIPTEDTGFHNIVITDKGMGKPIPNYEDLRRFFEREAPYVSHSKMCFRWNGTHYVPYRRERLEEYAQERFNPTAQSFMVKEFADLVLRTNLVDPEDWNESTARKINFRNGFLDLASMKFNAHDSTVGFRYCLPYDYDPKAQATVFKKFLSDIMKSDEQLQNILLEFGGYSLSGDDCKAAKALFLIGEGANGKSTFAKVLQALAGGANYTSLSLKELSNMERCHGLDGALFNIAEETPDKVADSTAFKNLVDGGQLYVRKLYSDNYRITNRAKLIFTGNTLPETYDYTKGYRRRLLIVPFEVDFKDGTWVEDKDIDIKLYAELSGIFNLMLEAYQRFVRNGKRFTESKRAEETLREFEIDNDSVKSFLNDEIDFMPPDENGQFKQRIALSRLYRLYAQYCTENRLYTLHSKRFYKRLSFALPKEGTSRKHRTKQGRFIAGIALRQHTEESESSY